MTVIRIRSGTPQSAEPLCNSCYWAHLQRGFAESEEVVLCAFLRPARSVPFKVSQCTDYNDKRLPSKQDREDIAGIIRVGFASKTQPNEEERLGIVPATCAPEIAFGTAGNTHRGCIVVFRCLPSAAGPLNRSGPAQAESNLTQLSPRAKATATSRPKCLRMVDIGGST